MLVEFISDGKFALTVGLNWGVPVDEAELGKEVDVLSVLIALWNEICPRESTTVDILLP